MHLRVALLGSLRVGIDGAELSPVRLGRRERAVLTVLALNTGHVVATTRLLDELWPEGLPDSANNALQVYISRLRKTLGRQAIKTEATGYSLNVAPDDVDFVRFERLADRGARALAEGRYVRGAALLSEALSLWEGDVLADDVDVPASRAEAVRLSELRLSIIEDRIECDLAVGRGPHVVAELQALVEQHPFRERLLAALMTALFQAGRQAESLERYDVYRLRSVEELGLDPGLTVQGLQASILAGGDDLTRPPGPVVRSQQTGRGSSLPIPMTPLIGRDEVVRDLAELVQSPGVRLVTLTGPGGAGKTRVATAVAHTLIDHFTEGIWFVPLGTVTAEDVMWMSIAEAMNVPPDAQQPPELLAHIVHSEALFVLDNLEQVQHADRVLSQLLAAGPRIVIIATSRGPLHVTGEHEYPVPSLMLPQQAALAHAKASPAVQMFAQQARMVRPDFALTAETTEAVVEICRRLDGLPLGIELTAARCKLLTPSALLARLDHALYITDSRKDRPARQRTLKDTIAWSYDLLGPTAQAFFRALGVFAGGADLSAVSAVAGDLLGSKDPLSIASELVDASLLTLGAGPDGEPRLAMLETIRMFARSQLESTDELDDVRLRHARYFLSLDQEFHTLLVEGTMYPGRQGRRSSIDHENTREALGWALQGGGRHLAELLSGRGAESSEANLRLLSNAAKLLVTMGRWEQAVESLSPYASSGHGPLLRDLGVALCQLHRSEPHSRQYREGQRLLDIASSPPHRDTDALASLAGTWKGVDDSRAKAAYQRCLDLDPFNSYALGNVLEYEIAQRGDLSAVDEFRDQAVSAHRRCRSQADGGLNLPWAFFDLGRFALLLDQPYEASAAYAKAVHLSTTDHMLATTMASLRRMETPSGGPAGLSWAHRLLALARVARFTTPDAWHGLLPMSPLPEVASTTPVAMLVGGTDASTDDWLAEHEHTATEGFRSFSGVIVSGGTRNGVAGLAGSLPARYGRRLTTIGYTPTVVPVHAAVDTRYGQIRGVGSDDFDLSQSLQAWVDLIASGVRPSEVRVLGINGGVIAAAEFRVALALGAAVGIVNGSGREADRLLADPDWQDAPNLVRFDLDANEIDRFLTRVP